MNNTLCEAGNNMSLEYYPNKLDRTEALNKKKRAGKLTGLIRSLAICGLTLFGGYAMAAVSATELRDPMEYFFHQSFNNLEEELELAIEENKSGVFIMFVDKDCPWCLKMKSTIMNRADVQDYYRKHFRLLTIDINGDTLMTDFAGNELLEKDFAFKLHRVRATPVFMFFDTAGKMSMRYTGITLNAAEFIWLAEYVVSGEYKNTNFTRYKQNRKKLDKAVSLN